MSPEASETQLDATHSHGAYHDRGDVTVKVTSLKHGNSLIACKELRNMSSYLVHGIQCTWNENHTFDRSAYRRMNAVIVAGR
jgi:hypothetical protein